MTVFQIIYASAATQVFSGEELKSILKTARRNNTALDVSGMLVYHGGSFLQVLEGPEEAVTRVYDTVGRDRRHTKVKVLLREATAEREFGNWSMGFVDTTSSAHESDGFVAYESDLRDLTLDKTRAKKLFRMFQDGSWRQKIDG